MIVAQPIDGAQAQKLRRLQIAAWLAVIVHLLAGLTMALILRYGLAANPNVNARLAFIANERALWICGWLPWNLAAFCILLFFYMLLAANKGSASPKFMLPAALIVCHVAVLFDLSSQYIAMTALPNLAESAASDPKALAKFHEYYQVIVLVSGGVANGAYTLATVLAAWATREIYPRWVTGAALAVGVIGAAVTVSSLIDSIVLQVASNAALIPTLAVWLAGIAITARRLVKNCTEHHS